MGLEEKLQKNFQKAWPCKRGIAKKIPETASGFAPADRAARNCRGRVCGAAFNPGCIP
ncbi:hypothetical protein TREPR_0792 [Treponema primitia ZAS-2]|uniref:Uncharacterized protein n=1 Tax=Treponema primitia (strain ATCC BAA-887 / DSM 12427 / ZAS-2) TaxID=545694 RepID=F5YJA4_TREPZ|nr:hypothetical protein TREPR_0792 [Treponema primitia ZAS-2]